MNKIYGIAIIVFLTGLCHADNPIIQTKYTADPAPMVYDGTVYLYTTHDEDDATGFKMFNCCSIFRRIWSIGYMNLTNVGANKRSNGLTAIVHGPS